MMREELGLRLRHNVAENTLIVRFREGIVTSSKEKEKVVANYDSEGNIVGYEIKNFSNMIDREIELAVDTKDPQRKLKIRYSADDRLVIRAKGVEVCYEESIIDEVFFDENDRIIGYDIEPLSRGLDNLTRGKLLPIYV